MKGWRPIKLEELSEDTQKVYDILNQEPDLACVLIGTSYLSELLASTLSVSFIKSRVAEKLLDPKRGVIGGFVSRADLAYCLGLIAKNAYNDLLKVAEIRNKFAHRYLALDFGDQAIQTECDKLQAWRVLLHDDEEEHSSEDTEGYFRKRARNQFNLSVVLLGNRIHLDALGRRGDKEKAESS